MDEKSCMDDMEHLGNPLFPLFTFMLQLVDLQHRYCTKFYNIVDLQGTHTIYKVQQSLFVRALFCSHPLDPRPDPFDSYPSTHLLATIFFK